MQRLCIALFLLFVCIFAMHYSTATEESQSAESDLRILSLLPSLSSPLAVEPGIPDDFIALSPQGTLHPYEWIYWGPRNVLKAYFENPASLKVPILRVKLSANTAQIGPHAFSDAKSLELLQKKDPYGFASIETQWGDYPILAIRTLVENRLIFLAWVGLNDPQAGWTLMFNLVYPDEDGHPNKEDRQLWERLIMSTTQLQDANYFKACGQDLQEGCTHVNAGGAKLKMLAEKRLSDGQIQVVVIPENPKVTFHYIDMTECLMGAKWRYGEPMVKVNGEVRFKEEHFESTTNCITSIFFKTVPEFSLKSEDEKNLLIYQKACTPSGEKNGELKA